MKFRLLVATVVFVQALLIYHFVAQRFPLSGDDYSYLYQARLFAAGRLYAEDPLYDHRQPLNRCIAVNCLRDERGRRFSKYAPGWPAVLSAGAVIDAPWLIPALLVALLTWLLLGHVEREMGRHAPPAAALLLVLCAFFSYYGASYRAHLVTAVCIFAAFLAYERGRRTDAAPALWILLSGLSLGASTLMRYTDWIPLAVWIAFTLVRGRRYRDLTTFTGTVILCGAGNLAWGWLLSGQPFVAPTHLGGDIGDHDRLGVTWAGVGITAARLALVFWVFPPVVLIIGYWRRLRAAAADLTPLWLFLANAAVYYLFAAAVAGPGPRYFFSYFPFLVIAVVQVYVRFIRDGSVVDRRWWHVVLAAQVAGSAIFVARETYTLYYRRDLERTLAAAPAAGSRRAVLLSTGTYHTDAMDLTRNPPDLASAETLYLAHCDPAQVESLMQQLPGRERFLYAYPGRLSRLED